jgi:hypothetical protein
MLRVLARLGCLFGCCEIIPLTRRTFGFGFCLLLAMIYTVKHQLLVYLPVSVAYQSLNEYAALALAIHLLGRFVSARMAARHLGVPRGYHGTPWLRYLGMSDRAARLYAEPLLALGIALWAAQTVVWLRFRPLFFLHDLLPMPYGVATPFPLWYRRHGVMIAHALPVVSALALALFNRLSVPKPVDNTPPKEDPLTFSEVSQPASAALPVPSAAHLARALLYRKGHT